MTMKLWTFLFPSPTAPLQSARVVAADRICATILLAQRLGEAMPDDVICNYSGKTEDTIEKVIRIVLRDGTIHEAD